MVAARQMDRSIYDTVQTIPSVMAGTGNTLPMTFRAFNRGQLLPAKGTHLREYALVDFENHEQNTLFIGAMTGAAKKIASTPFEVIGDDDEEVRYFTNLLRHAQFRQGWTEFVKQWVRNYWRHDLGVWTEIIAPGDPRYDPKFRATGIAVLDTLRCYPTGDPRYPVIYIDDEGERHTLPASRVLHTVDMPESDRRYRDYGTCALSRAIAVAQRQVLMGQYIATRLDDDPPPGIQTFQGISREGGWEAALATYLQRQSTDGRPIFGRTVQVFGLDPANEVKVENVPFSVAPEAFDWEVYVNVDVKMLALAIGMDVQEIWELTSGALGSGAQSEIQHEKSKGKALGDMYALLERDLNDVLPESCEFKFKPRDTQADREEADNAQTWTGVTLQLNGILNVDEQRRLLAAKVQAIKDVVTDPSGRIVRYDDADPRPPEQVIGSDLSALAPEGEQGSLAALADTSADEDAANANPLSVLKAYAGTRENFAREVTALIRKGLRSQVTRRQFGIQFRALLRRSGLLAFRDGLIDGGVDDPLDDADTAQVLAWLAEQSTYVTNLGDEIYQRGFSLDVARNRGEMWANKSLQTIYDAGRMSADANGQYRWVIDGAREHCRDCLKLNGQIHRLRDWYRRDLFPRGNRLACHGYNCTCKLERTEGKARGRFLNG